MAKQRLTYKAAGVDVDANARWVDRIQHAMRDTYGPRVIAAHNAFAGLFRLDFDEQLFRRNYRQPVLVGCADGVGSKVLLASEAGDLSTVGIDLVAMNVNDLITTGAEPLFFLDYLAVHHIEPQRLAEVIEGIAAGCKEAGCTLLGGETAEMPDLYDKEQLDLAGFAVGVVELNRRIDVRRVEPGDTLIGLPSSGIHSNGYSLVRKAISAKRWKLDRYVEELGETLQAALLRPTRIYVKPVVRLLRAYRVKRVVTGMAHITGGGLAENVARILPAGCNAIIRKAAWKIPPVFGLLEGCGIAKKEMYRVFNMGIGFVLAVRPDFAKSTCRRLERFGESPVIIGQVTRGQGKVTLR